MVDLVKFVFVMENFWCVFYEFYYCDYIGDDIDVCFLVVGFEGIIVEIYFMMWVWLVCKFIVEVS